MVTHFLKIYVTHVRFRRSFTKRFPETKHDFAPYLRAGLNIWKAIHRIRQAERELTEQTP